MNILRELQTRFARALAGLASDTAPLLDLVRRSQDARFGEYQANFAMPLGKQLSRPSRDVAEEVVKRLDVADLAQPPEVAGPGFINVRLRDDWLAAQLARAVADPRLGIEPVANPRTYVIDYSAPNVAKPMHVGHIRSTVIGDSIDRTLRFLGHRAISDNHIGDWGTQFGMILYGYKHFLDAEAYRAQPVQELARQYRLVRKLMDYQGAKVRLVSGEMDRKIEAAEAAIAEARKPLPAGVKPKKDAAKALRKLESDREELCEEREKLEALVRSVEADPPLSRLVAAHPEIGAKVLAETAKLHADDEENLRLWREFVPSCLDEIERVYRRLGVKFDHTLGESYYHGQLAPLVEDLLRRGIAQVSVGAVCVFVEGIAVPMIIRKQDGAFLYATTDLATLEYRVREWNPDAILYVVDFRQGLHFEQLFSVARRLGHESVELQHVSFGTVLGKDGKPFKTRAGDTVGLEGLLDEGVERAYTVVSTNDDAKPGGPELSPEERKQVSEVVGIGAIKYADLSQNRTSDYVFDYDKMLAMNGNTATYMQYAYARVRSIFRKGNVDVAALRASAAAILLSTPAERALGVELLRFSEAIDLAVADYRPHQLTGYLFDLANRYSTFFENCPVLRAESEPLRQSRLLLCDLTARTIKQGLELLGIGVVEKM
jgi:arginyl-tRNA synthetase